MTKKNKRKWNMNNIVIVTIALISVTPLIDASSLLSFTITLPGNGPINSNNISTNYTSNMIFNTSTNNQYNMDPCVEGTLNCQTEEIPFYQYVNTGDTNFSISLLLDNNLSEHFMLTANSIYNFSNASALSTSPTILVPELRPGQSAYVYFFGSIFNAYPADSIWVNLTSMSTNRT